MSIDPVLRNPKSPQRNQNQKDKKEGPLPNQQRAFFA